MTKNDYRKTADVVYLCESKQKKLYAVMLIIFFCLSFVLCPIASFAEKSRKTKKANSENVIKNKTEKKADKSSSDKGSEKKVKNDTDAALTEETGLPQKEYTENDFKPKVEEESYAWMVIKTLFILSLLIGGFYYFFRFVTKKTGIQLMGQNVLQTLSILPLGQNKYLQVVDLAGKILVLGVTDNNINLIKEIVEKDEIDRIRLLSSKSGIAIQKNFQEQIAAQIGKFVNRVNQIRDKNKFNSNEEEKIEAGVDLNFLKNQKDRLKNLNGFENE